VAFLSLVYGLRFVWVLRVFGFVEGYSLCSASGGRFLYGMPCKLFLCFCGVVLWVARVRWGLIGQLIVEEGER